MTGNNLILPIKLNNPKPLILLPMFLPNNELSHILLILRDIQDHVMAHSRFDHVLLVRVEQGSVVRVRVEALVAD